MSALRSGLLLGALATAGCQLATIPPGTLFHCEADGGCSQPGYTCGADLLCRAPGNQDGGCFATSCQARGLDCGRTLDGCECGTCPLEKVCGLGGAPNVCAVDTNFCSDAGWCWENPRPQGNSLRGAWAFSPNDVWAVGDVGTVVRWNGAVWYHMPIPTSRDLASVWGSSPSDVWVVGAGGTALHFDGTRWLDTTGQLTADLTAVWGSGPSDVWVCGDFTVGRWDGGGSWGTQPIPLQDEPVRALWGSGPGDVYAVGGGPGNGRAYHWNGSGWSQTPWDGGEAAAAIWGLGPSQVFITSAQGLFVLDGGTFVSSGIQRPLSAVGGSGPNDLWAGGGQGSLVHSDGGAWGLAHDFDPTQPDLLAIASLPGGPVRAVGSGGALGILSESGGATFLAPVVTDLSSGWGASPANVWAGGQMGYYFTRSSGGQWVVSRRPASETLFGAWGFSATDLWFVGSIRRAEHFTGTWQESIVNAADGNSNRAIWGSAPSDLWVVGDVGTVAHSSGGAFTAVPSPIPSVSLRAVSGVDPSHAWIAGDLGTMLGWDGGVLGLENTGTTATLYGVVGLSTDEAWTVGAGGLILHRAGGAWSPLTTNLGTGTLRGLWAVGTSDLWTVGDRGLAAHWDGTNWNRSETGTNNQLNAVWALPNDGGVFAAGERGAILRHP